MPKIAPTPSPDAAPRHRKPSHYDRRGRPHQPLLLPDIELDLQPEGADEHAACDQTPGDLDQKTPNQADLAEIVGGKLAIFEDMIYPTPEQITAVRKMDTLRHMGLRQRSSTQRRAYRFLQPSGSGKSTCAKLLKSHVERQAGRDPEKKPVLHVTLSTTGTPKSLATSILTAFGDGYAGRGEADVLLERVKVLIEEFGVELLIIDELNHFNQAHLAKDAANTIKNILTLGWAPIVLMGTVEAQSLFADNRELKMRSAPQDILRPYDFRDEEHDLPVWIELMKRIDAGLVKRNVLSRKSGLDDPHLAKDLCEASNGLIGEFHNIILAALEPTLLANESMMSKDRLIGAVDAWCLADDTIGHNPLRLRQADKQ